MRRAAPCSVGSFRGVLLVEEVVYLALFPLIILGLVTILRTETQVDAKMRRLDSLHEIRQTSWKLSRWLTFGTKVLSPPVASDPAHWFDKVLFADQAQVKRLIYLDSARRLKMCSSDGRAELLAEHVLDFGVKRIDEFLVLYRIQVSEPKGGKTFLLSNTIQMRNSDVAAVGANHAME